MDVTTKKQCGNAGKKSIILSSEQSLNIVQWIKLEKIEWNKKPKVLSCCSSVTDFLVCSLNKPGTLKKNSHVVKIKETVGESRCFEAFFLRFKELDF